MDVRVGLKRKLSAEELITRGPWEFHRIGDNFFVFYGVLSSAAQVFRMSDCGLLGEFFPVGMGPTEPHELQPTRLLHPWDFPGKSTGVGCHCLLQENY